MLYLSHFIHAWLVFVTPLIFLNYKTTIRQQALFTIIYGLGVAFSRNIYDFVKVPFGTHTILLIILSIVLFKNILKDFGWNKSIYTSLIIVIILLINDTLILLPLMKMFNLTITGVEKRGSLGFIPVIILSNLILILIYVTFSTRNLIYRKKRIRQTSN